MTENDADTPEVVFYRVAATVTDTEGHNVDAGEQFRHTFVTGGPDVDYIHKRFREHCEDLGFVIDDEIETEPMDVESMADLEAWLTERMDAGDQLGHDPLWNDMTGIPVGEGDDE
jgi:hypothetical protein